MSDQNASLSFDPNAELGYLLEGAKRGKVSIITVYQALLRAPVYAMFDREVTPDNLDPQAGALIFETEDMGNLMVLFTEPELADRVSEDVGEYGFPGQLSGEYIINVIDEDTGLIINPGHDYGMKLSGVGLQRLKRDFGSRVAKPDSESAPAPSFGGPSSGGTPFPSLN